MNPPLTPPTPNSGEQIFSTQNLALAAALLTAGFRPVSTSRPCTVVFDSARLRAIGARTIPEARRKGERGAVTYHFVAAEGIDLCVRAFDTARRVATSKEHGDDEVKIENATQDEATFIAAMALANRKWLLGAADAVAPMLKVRNADGKTCLIGEGTPPEALEDWGIKL